VTFVSFVVKKNFVVKTKLLSCDTVKPTILESDPKASAAIRAAKQADKAKPKAEKSLALFQ
jgi:hypothetical protein